MSQPLLPEFPPSYKIRRIPPDVIDKQRQHPLLAGLYVMSTGYFPRAEGHFMERSWIRENIIIYCVEGSGWFRANQQTWTIQKGQVVFVLAGTAHAYGADAAQPWTIHWAHFDGAQAARLLELALVSPTQPVISIGERLNIVTLFNEILHMLQSGYSWHYLINAAACLRHLLSSIALLNTYSPPAGVRDLNVEQMIGLMLAHLDQPGRLDNFAALACMSASHFSHRFREKTGYAPIDYFIRLKMQKACELLETTGMKVAEIGQKLGYKDPYYFSRMFKKIIGASPQQYRINREV